MSTFKKVRMDRVGGGNEPSNIRGLDGLPSAGSPIELQREDSGVER